MKDFQKIGAAVFMTALVLGLAYFGATRSIHSGKLSHSAMLSILDTQSAEADARLEHATFAMGCFWHSEEIFLELKGVTNALPGYAGGKEPNPSYELVGSGETEYAESVDVTYDPSIISYDQLLQVFFAEHDPTTPDYAAPDRGHEYRSAIFYRDAYQKQRAEGYIAQLNSSDHYGKPIITQVAPLTKFWRAEDYHVRYFREHPEGQSYIDNVTRPEIMRFRQHFPQLLKVDLPK